MTAAEQSTYCVTWSEEDRELAISAAEQGASVNQYVASRLVGVGCISLGKIHELEE